MRPPILHSAGGVPSTVVWVLLLATLATRAAAQPPPPALNWVRLEGAEGCLAAPQLADRIEARLDRMVFVAVGDAELFIDGSVTGTEEGFRVALEVSDTDGSVLGERVLSFAGQDCAVIDDAVTFVIAVTLYPDTGLAGGIPLSPEAGQSLHALFGDEPSELDPTTLPDAPVAPMEASADSSQTLTPPTRRPDDRDDDKALAITVGFDAIAAAATGSVPDVATAIGGYLRLSTQTLGSFEVGIQGTLPVSARPAAGPGQAEFGEWAGSLVYCPWEPLSALHLCGGARLGAVTFRSDGFASGSEESLAPMFDVLLATVFRPRLAGPIHLRLGANMAIPVVQHTFSYSSLAGNPDATLFRTSQILLRAEAGLGAEF